jgi:quercetin dioxygenase-like cupin family protein
MSIKKVMLAVIGGSATLNAKGRCKMGNRRLAAVGVLGMIVLVGAAMTVMALPTGVKLNVLPANVVIPGGEFTATSGNWEAQLESSGPMRIITQHAILAPGGQFDWHKHSGMVIGEVVSGTMTFYEGADQTCTGRPLSAGQGFAENGGEVHNSRNEGTVDVEAYFTYIMPPDGVRTTWVPNPGVCAFRGF